MGPSDHMAIHLHVSCDPILINCQAYENYEKTNWVKYKDNLKDVPQINLESASLYDIEGEIKCLYKDLNLSKEKSTPIVTMKRVRTAKCTVKYKRLTKILDYYSNKLLTTGKTPYLERKLNETRNALVD